MPQPMLIITDANLTQYPAHDETKLESQITIGDLHGNALFYIYFLIQEGVLTLEKKDEDYTALKKLYKDSSPTLSGSVVTEGNLSRLNLDTFKDILKRATINPQALKDQNKDFAVRLIGDETADRGANDYFTLMIYKKLLEGGVPVETLISNHGLEFIEATEKRSFEYLRLQKQHACSMGALKKLLASNLLSREEVDELNLAQNLYKNTHKAVSYTLSQDENSITVYSHAGIDIQVINCLAQKLNALAARTGIPSNILFQADTAKNLAATIDSINAVFNAYVKADRIIELYDSKKLSEAYATGELIIDPTTHPFEFLMWNRKYDALQRNNKSSNGAYEIYYSHGHDGDRHQHYEYGAHILNLNGHLGQFTEAMGELTLVRATGTSQVTPAVRAAPSPTPATPLDHEAALKHILAVKARSAGGLVSLYDTPEHSEYISETDWSLVNYVLRTTLGEQQVSPTVEENNLVIAENDISLAILMKNALNNNLSPDSLLSVNTIEMPGANGSYNELFYNNLDRRLKDLPDGKPLAFPITITSQDAILQSKGHVISVCFTKQGENLSVDICDSLPLDEDNRTAQALLIGHLIQAARPQYKVTATGIKTAPQTAADCSLHAVFNSVIHENHLNYGPLTVDECTSLRKALDTTNKTGSLEDLQKTVSELISKRTIIDKHKTVMEELHKHFSRKKPQPHLGSTSISLSAPSSTAVVPTMVAVTAPAVSPSLSVNPTLDTYQALIHHYLHWVELAKGSRSEFINLQQVIKNCDTIEDQLNQADRRLPGLAVLQAKLQTTRNALAMLKTQGPQHLPSFWGTRLNSSVAADKQTITTELKNLTQRDLDLTHLQADFTVGSILKDKALFVQGMRASDHSFISEAYLSANLSQDELREFVFSQIESFHADPNSVGKVISFQGNFSKEYLTEAINYCKLRGYAWEIAAELKNKKLAEVATDPAALAKLQSLFNPPSDKNSNVEWKTWLVAKRKTPISELLDKDTQTAYESQLHLAPLTAREKQQAREQHDHTIIRQPTSAFSVSTAEMKRSSEPDEVKDNEDLDPPASLSLRSSSN